MIVAIGGMHRSGSTFSFNIVREILEGLGRVIAISDNSLTNALGASVDADHLIIKTHAPDELVNGLISKKAIPCICTYRKPEDAIASWIRVFGGTLESATAIVESWLKWHSQIRDRVLNIAYEQIEEDPIATIRQIQRYLSGTEDSAQAANLGAKYRKEALKNRFDLLQKNDGTTDIGFSYYDNETFFHRRHISSIRPISAAEEFSQDQISILRDQLSDFVDIDGNYKLQNSNAKQ